MTPPRRLHPGTPSSVLVENELWSTLDHPTVTFHGAIENLSGRTTVARRTTLEAPWSNPAGGTEAPVAAPAAALDVRGLTKLALGDLVLRDTLGEGGMGRVVAADQRSLGREVAVKLPKPGARATATTKALLDEGRIIGRLEHPNIVPVHLLAETPDGSPALVMKRVEGVPWSNLIDFPELLAQRRSGGRDVLEQHLRILLAVCDAVAFAHARGVVHRDLKPDNVMVGAFGEVYVLDWGLALELGPGDMRATELVGTPCCLPPEFLDTSLPLGPAADVFLLGACLHNVLTRRMRYEGGDIAEILRAASVCAPFDYDPEVPDELAQLCRAAMLRSPRERPSSVAAFREAIERFLVHRPSLVIASDAMQQLVRLEAMLTSGREALSASACVADEAHFGFRQSLRIWPENPEALRGVERWNAASARLELSRENAEAARARIDSLAPEVAAPLRHELEDLERALAERAQAALMLAEARHSRDLEVSFGARSAVVFSSTVVAGAATLSAKLYEQQHGLAWMDMTSLFLVHVATLLGTGLAVLALRKALFRNAANARAVVVLGGVLLAVLANRYVSLQMKALPPLALASDLMIFATGVFSCGVFIARPWTGASLLAVVPGIVAAHYPQHAELLFVVGVCSMMCYATLVYRPWLPKIRVGIDRLDGHADRRVVSGHDGGSGSASSSPKAHATHGVTARMRSRIASVLCSLVLGCGGAGGGSGAPSGEAATRPMPTVDAPSYRVHEWGVISANSQGATVTAGPLTWWAPDLSVEKPVIYIHTDTPLALQLQVEVGAGYDVAEHYPPTSAMHFGLQATPGPCPERHVYPTTCASPDGICEIRELPRYETSDAACLRMGEHELPLLFYRLSHSGPASLPVEVRVQGNEVSTRATRSGVTAWRVATVGGEVRAVPVTIGQAWQVLPTPSQPWTDAEAALNASLVASGLTDEERAAFQRAWWQALFGAPAPGEAAAAPAMPTSIPREENGGVTSAPGAALAPDVLVYMMTPEEIDRVARIVATPAPSHVARAFMVRHML